MEVLAAADRVWQPGASLAWDLLPTSLGLALVAASPQGVCAVWLQDNEQSLLSEIPKRFAKATRVPPTADQLRWFTSVQRTIDDLQPVATVPLDCHGTVFQQRVWALLRTIPPGTTWTYQRIAAGLALPGATRAVGTACGANPVAVLVPCHRVIRADGGLGGYRWGVQRKEQLLARERARASAT